MSLTDFADQVLESFKAALGPGPRADLISQPPTYVTEKLAVPTGADHEDDGGFGAAVDGAEIHAPKDMAVPQGKDDRDLGLQEGHAFLVPLQGSPGGAQRGPDEALGQSRGQALPGGVVETKFHGNMCSGEKARAKADPAPSDYFFKCPVISFSSLEATFPGPNSCGADLYQFRFQMRQPCNVTNG